MTKNSRPRYVLEGNEDALYHERRLPKRGTEPEYCAFLDKSWVFNRAMRWIDAPGGTLLCYSEGGDLLFTGSGGVSEWFSDPVNEITQDDDGETRFVRKAARRPDCIVLPALQFNVERHSTVRLEVTEATTDWQFCVIIKGRAGAPVLASEWQSGARTLTFDLHATLRERGYDIHFVELFFVVGLWSTNPGGEDAIRFSMKLCARPAVVPCLPVIRTRQSAEADGVSISALVLDGSGKRRISDQATLTACAVDASCELTEQDGLWSGALPALSEGDHVVRLVAHGAVEAETTQVVRITDGHFLAYDAEHHSLSRNGVATGPLSGSYQGIVYAKNAGLPNETLVQGQEAFDAWDRSQPPGEHWHYWESLTEAELDARFSYLEKNGWNLLHICQHWGLWEKFDAGGRIAPHGAEQAALYYRTAARHGLAVVQALSHYQYGVGLTPPYRSTLNAGYKNEDWNDAGSAFTERFHGYLGNYATLFREETALAWMTASGEGDISAGADRVNDTCRFMAKRAPNHLFLSEPIHRMEELPREHYGRWDLPEWTKIDESAVKTAIAWQQPLYGSRLYWIGDSFEPELDLGIEFKLMQLGPVFMAEGSWPCPHLHAEFIDNKRSWCGSPEYRTRLRDSLYIGLVHRNPIMLTWEEQIAEDEHRLVDVIRRQVDWSQRFMEAPVAIRVDSSSVRDRREVLKQYEEIFSAWPLANRYLLPDAPAPEGMQAVFDAREGFTAPAFAADGGSIPDEVKRRMPLRISDEYRASYSWSEDRRTLLAYVHNCSAYLKCDHRSSLGGWFHRLPRKSPLQVGLQHFPSTPLVARVYDLTTKAPLAEQTFTGELSLDFGKTEIDVFVLVTPG